MNEIKVDNYKEMYESIIGSITNYIVSNGLKSMVIGISGGIDSTVVAALCHEASNRLRKRQHNVPVLGIFMPTVTNAADERESAHMVGQAFCNMYKEVPIDDAYDTLKSTCNEANSLSTDISRGNIKARIRMICLYNLASVTHGIVIGGANKTETLLGFMTIHGSDAGDFAPIANLWKSEVYGLAQYIEKTLENNEQRKAVGLSIALTPTDGNGVMRGGDMAQIAPGYTYAEVDTVLKALVETDVEHAGLKLADAHRVTLVLEEDGITDIMDENTIQDVCRRHFRTQYKRDPAPVIPKIGLR